MDISCDVNPLFHEEQGTGFRGQGPEGEGIKTGRCDRLDAERFTDFLTPPPPVCYIRSTPFKSNPERLKKVAPMTVKIGSCRPKTKDLPG
jgi:hypothetical protein